jgi:hypothetical protein
MTKQQFTNDLQILYDELQQRQSELNGYYRLLDDGHEEAQKIVADFLESMDLEMSAEHQMAALIRIVNLREDALEQVLSQAGFGQDAIIEKKEKAYQFAQNIHMQRHEALNSWIESENLLTPFYRMLIYGVHAVGIAMSAWQSHWTSHIIHGVNRDLFKAFKGDEEKIFQMLQDKALLDCHEGEVGDRCYSALHKDIRSGEYRSLAYATLFREEVSSVTDALDALIHLLDELEDEVYGQEEAWIAYFAAIREALMHTKPDELISKWAEVDRKWMAITTPMQVGHPLEYYEDHYRKAVALEWDLRIINPKLQEGSPTRSNIKQFASGMAEEFGTLAEQTMRKNLQQVEETQLYIGQPMLYYGAEFNGLFSAQVVPNDEQVSAELGKKIFAYADFVMESKKSKPTMRLSVEIMGADFVQKQKALIENNPALWQEIYDISTIGHEFGHILWIDADTETMMNTTGQFKNIEEFKATAGGLMAFFANEREALKEHIIDDVVSRAVGLMAWREVGEVLPYYCEGLIHLHLLFGSGVIRYEEEISIDYSQYDAMKEAYQDAYRQLAQCYLNKEDAGKYLSDYTIKEGAVYLPIDTKVRAFVEYYYAQYRLIGQQVWQ